MNENQIQRLLAELERLDAEATPGPWEIEIHGDNVSVVSASHTGALATLPNHAQREADLIVADVRSDLSFAAASPEVKRRNRANAALIAAARTALPALIEAARERDEIRALAERLARALEAASAAMPFLNDAQAMHGRAYREPDAEGVAIKIDAALSAARSAGLIEGTAPGHTDLMISPEGIDEALRQAAPETEDKGR